MTKYTSEKTFSIDNAYDIILKECDVIFSSNQPVNKHHLTIRKIVELTLKIIVAKAHPTIKPMWKKIPFLIECFKDSPEYNARFISFISMSRTTGNNDAHSDLNVDEIEYKIITFELYSYLKWFFSKILKKNPPTFLTIWYDRQISNTEQKSQQSVINLKNNSVELDDVQKKEAILNQINELCHEKSRGNLSKLLELQSEWAKIKYLPDEDDDRLWESYNFLIKNYYSKYMLDNSYQMYKNRVQKNEISQKIAALENYPDLRKRLLLLHEYQYEWKSIGPVKKEEENEVLYYFTNEANKIIEGVNDMLDEFENA